MNNYLKLCGNYEKLNELLTTSYFFNNFESEFTVNCKNFLEDFKCFLKIPVINLNEKIIKDFHSLVKDHDKFLKEYVINDEYPILSEDRLVLDVNNFFVNVVLDSTALVNEL